MIAPLAKNISHQKILKFRELIPGILSTLPRLPTIIKTLKMALSLNDKDPFSVGAIIEENAIKCKERTALIFQDRSRTYEAFNQEANRMANYLLTWGVKPGDNIASLINNRPEILFTITAASKIGARVSLINFNLRKKVLSYCVNILLAECQVIFEPTLNGLKKL